MRKSKKNGKKLINTLEINDNDLIKKETFFLITSYILLKIIFYIFKILKIKYNLHDFLIKPIFLKYKIIINIILIKKYKKLLFRLF